VPVRLYNGEPKLACWLVFVGTAIERGSA